MCLIFMTVAIFDADDSLIKKDYTTSLLRKDITL